MSMPTMSASRRPSTRSKRAPPHSKGCVRPLCASEPPVCRSGFPARPSERPRRRSERPSALRNLAEENVLARAQGVRHRADPSDILGVGVSRSHRRQSDGEPRRLGRQMPGHRAGWCGYGRCPCQAILICRQEPATARQSFEVLVGVVRGTFAPPSAGQQPDAPGVGIQACCSSPIAVSDPVHGRVADRHPRTEDRWRDLLRGTGSGGGSGYTPRRDWLTHENRSSFSHVS